jgi:secondary thiamine-phosphate synthase enzyme
LLGKILQLSSHLVECLSVDSADFTKISPAQAQSVGLAMKVVTRSLEVKSRSENDVVDITSEVQEAVAASALSDGVATVFVVGSTAAITTMEHEPGLVTDFPDMLERVAPKSGVEYEHQRRWHDGNGHSHVKASLVGPGLSIPFVDGELVLGEWQQVVLVEFDTRPRSRKVVVQLMGE